ncbi:S-adenosyl-L-methionine-dependent methyltransferase [Mycena latifolia]|nr:S-adenosyl-L-methionine-dependent methyltransferase [Mycena latifolia]
MCVGRRDLELGIMCLKLTATSFKCLGHINELRPSHSPSNHNTAMASQYTLDSRDDFESQRLSTQHRAYSLAIGGKLHPYDFEAAPKDKDGARVLDIGTGNGIWALELAQRMPGVQIVGTDIVEVKPVQAVPSNVSFVVHDVLTLPTTPYFDVESFDVIHVRFLQHAVRDMAGMIKSLRPLLRTGGILLLCEASMATFAKTGGPLAGMFLGFAEKSGLDPLCGENLERDLAGDPGAWTDVKRFDVNIPIGEWGPDETKAAGREMKEATTMMLDGALAVFRKNPQPGISTEQVEGLFAGIKGEIATLQVEWGSTYMSARKA